MSRVTTGDITRWGRSICVCRHLAVLRYVARLDQLAWLGLLVPYWHMLTE